MKMISVLTLEEPVVIDGEIVRKIELEYDKDLKTDTDITITGTIKDNGNSTYEYLFSASSINDILSYVNTFSNEDFSITIPVELMKELFVEKIDNGYKVSIETSGCVPIEDLGYRRSFKYVMDIKCPSSGVAEKNIFENLLHLQPNDEVKFVIANREDYEYMKSVLRKYPSQAKILASPMFDENNKAVIGKDLVDWIIEDRLNVRVQIQLHKILEVR